MCVCQVNYKFLSLEQQLNEDRSLFSVFILCIFNFNVMYYEKVSTVRKLCKACNLDSKGSWMDLVVRIREEMKTRHSYDKIFQKIWGASGKGYLYS